MVIGLPVPDFCTFWFFSVRSPISAESSVKVIPLWLVFQRSRRLAVKETFARLFIWIPHGQRHEVEARAFPCWLSRGSAMAEGLLVSLPEGWCAARQHRQSQGRRMLLCAAVNHSTVPQENQPEEGLLESWLEITWQVLHSYVGLRFRFKANFTLIWVSLSNG